MQGQSGPGSDAESNRFVRSPGPLKTPVHLLSIEKEIAELQRRARHLEKRKLELLNEVKDGSTRLKIPGCTVPWKYTFARSTGNARLCPYADIDVGSIEEVFPRSYNSTLLSRIRRGFSQNRSVLAVCENCTDDHREFRIDTLREYMNSIAL